MLKIFIFSLLTSSTALAQSLQCKDIFLSESFETSSRSPDRLFIQRVLLIKNSDLRQFKNGELLNIYALFAKWNLLPPIEFQDKFFAIMTGRLDSWSAKDYLSFANARKLTPAMVPEDFLLLLKKNILTNFSSFNITTQLEVLGAEIFRQTPFSVREMNSLLQQAIGSLAKTNETLRLKPLKELYRALLYLRAKEPTVFFMSTLALEQQLERQMQSQGLSFSEDGTSGAINQPTTKRGNRLLFEARLDALFAGDQKIEEYSNTAQLGFYDPVDILYPERGLVVEWDGPHHYFRNLILGADQSVIGFEGSFLRPMDQVKDAILRRQGYDILRISPQLNDQLITLDILGLIEQQNK